MSIPSIPSTIEVARVSSSTSQRTATASAGTAATTPNDTKKATAAPDEATATATPSPPRFPWLSFLSQQLASAAKQKPAFPSAPVLGDTIDKSA